MNSDDTIVTAWASAPPPWQLGQLSPAAQFLTKCRQRLSVEANLQLALIIPQFSGQAILVRSSRRMVVNR